MLASMASFFCGSIRSNRSVSQKPGERPACSTHATRPRAVQKCEVATKQTGRRLQVVCSQSVKREMIDVSVSETVQLAGAALIIAASGSVQRRHAHNLRAAVGQTRVPAPASDPRAHH